MPVAQEAASRWRSIPTTRRARSSGCRASSRTATTWRGILKIVDTPANGLTLCSGSLGAGPQNNVEALVREFGGMGRIHFAHIRNVKVTPDGDFEEAAHMSSCGSLDIAAIVKAYHDVGFEGYAGPTMAA